MITPADCIDRASRPQYRQREMRQSPELRRQSRESWGAKAARLQRAEYRKGVISNRERERERES